IHRRHRPPGAIRAGFRCTARSPRTVSSRRISHREEWRIGRGGTENHGRLTASSKGAEAGAPHPRPVRERKARLALADEGTPDGSATGKRQVGAGEIIAIVRGGAGMTRREFQLIDGSSKKFWAIEFNSTSFTVHFGRIGTAGQAK